MQLHEMVKHGAASSIMRTGRAYAIKRTKEALRQKQKQRSGSVTSGNSREKIWILTLRILLKSISLIVENRLRESTIKNKRYVFDLKVTPYFKKKKMCEIKTSDIRAWQNELIKQGYAPTYLKSINNQLAALFNYAVRYYDLNDNPCMKAGSIGKSKADDMEFWTKQEFKQFLPSMDKKPEVRMAFMLLYWTGMRIGDDDDKIRLNQRKPSKYKGLSRFGPEKNLQRINKFMKERPTFYKKLIQMKENFRFYLRCFYCITKVVILQFNSEKQDRISS